ncbi:ArsR family transcriptional regulator [Streptomyces sp. NPDC007369]|uniref:ArsR/SmtB family transcription factor n=1 Tax=Streptomyces sp. NPDC007369 TaxID=3154589 RepID=UPI0033CC6831
MGRQGECGPVCSLGARHRSRAPWRRLEIRGRLFSLPESQAGDLCLKGFRHVPLPVVLFPSPLTSTWLLSVDPWNQRGPYLIYPATSEATTAHPAATAQHPLTDVIGHTRFTLLASLASAHTTSDLARHHHLSPSTVSYHLTHLHRVGLVTRAKTGKQVHYQQTALAAELVDQACSGRRRRLLAARRRQGASSTEGVVSA